MAFEKYKLQGLFSEFYGILLPFVLTRGRYENLHDYFLHNRSRDNWTSWFLSRRVENASPLFTQGSASPNLLGIPQPWSITKLKQQRYSGYQRVFLACDEQLSPGGRPAAEETNGSENVTKKVNSRCFKLHCPYSNSFNLSNVGDFFRSWILNDCI